VKFDSYIDSGQVFQDWPSEIKPRDIGTYKFVKKSGGGYGASGISSFRINGDYFR